MSNCPWSIRPFTDETQVDCDKSSSHLANGDPEHKGALINYAYPGSITEVSWMVGDRREFKGEFPGYCHKLDSVTGPPDSGGHVCTLPTGHHGRCAS